MDKKDNKTGRHWISFRVKPEEYNQIHGHFSTTTCRKLSEYVRKVLLQKPVVVKHRNESADEFLSAMIPLKKDLDGMANNFNQAVKKLHSLSELREFKGWLMLYESEKKSMLEKVEEIKLHIQKIYEKWLQE